MAGLARIPRALAFSAAQKREIRFQRGGRAAGYSAVCLSEIASLQGSLGKWWTIRGRG